jgi:Adenylosuccinate lyase (EC 4.3.2.2)
MLAILPIDSGRYGTKEMMDIFSEQKKIDYQLEIEGAAAVSQSEIGIIPKTSWKKDLKGCNFRKNYYKEN